MDHSELRVSLDCIKSELAKSGFLLCDTRTIASLPSSIWLKPSLIPQRYQSGSVLLVAHAGKQFWQAFSQNTTDENKQKPNPVDTYSVGVTELTLEKCLPSVTRQRLFPHADCPVNLLALGRAFGWHSPSPLGMGIHKQYGLWSAYRAVWWLDIDLPEGAPVREKFDVCLQCQTQECVAACPSSAVTYGKKS